MAHRQSTLMRHHDACYFGNPTRSMNVVTCTSLALLRKSLIYNGAGEGNRTLVTGIVVYCGIVC